MLQRDKDGNVITKDGVGVTPGVDVLTWLIEMQPKRPRWWPESVGGGATGTRTSHGQFTTNPWMANNWNVTAQGEFIRANGMDKAQQAAKLAGTTVGGAKPLAKAA
jgi:hypothetical protein